MNKRICILLLAAALLTGCGNGGTVETDKTADTAGSADIETESETLSEAEQIAASLPTGDYGGYEFAMLNNESNFAYTQMCAEELTGEGDQRRDLQPEQHGRGSVEREADGK